MTRHIEFTLKLSEGGQEKILINTAIIAYVQPAKVSPYGSTGSIITLTTDPDGYMKVTETYEEIREWLRDDVIHSSSE